MSSPSLCGDFGVAAIGRHYYHIITTGCDFYFYLKSLFALPAVNINYAILIKNAGGQFGRKVEACSHFFVHVVHALAPDSRIKFFCSFYYYVSRCYVVTLLCPSLPCLVLPRSSGSSMVGYGELRANRFGVMKRTKPHNNKINLISHFT